MIAYTDQYHSSKPINTPWYLIHLLYKSLIPELNRLSLGNCYKPLSPEMRGSHMGAAFCPSCSTFDPTPHQLGKATRDRPCVWALLSMLETWTKFLDSTWSLQLYGKWTNRWKNFLCVSPFFYVNLTFK